jgi:formylmethanofuran dehydrogenase subunit B
VGTAGAPATITCPFCGLACDDLRVAATQIDVRGCPKAAEGFARADAPLHAHAVAGRPVDLEAAAAAAADILEGSLAPLFHGLAADLHGIRAVLALAERCGGVVDHVNSAGLLANAAVARASGWVTATFAEIANRADFILIVGGDPNRSFPRFAERLIENRTPLYREARPVVAFLGEAPAPPFCHPGLRVIVPADELLDAIGLLAAIVAGRPPQTVPDEVQRAALQALAERLAGAQYGAVVWDAMAFAPPEAELAVELLAGITRRLNARTRCVGLPLGGGENGLGALQATLWQTGWPLRVGFADGAPQHDPWRFDGRRLIAAGEADVVVWIAALAPCAPPPAEAPVIAIVAADVVLPEPAAVEIRVGIPGVDHAGEIVRSDGILTLPLHAPRPSERPSVAAAARAILGALEGLR